MRFLTLTEIFKFGRNVNLDSERSGLEFGGRRSKANMIGHKYLKAISSDLAKMSTWIQDKVIRFWFSKANVHPTLIKTLSQELFKGFSSDLVEISTWT